MKSERKGTKLYTGAASRRTVLLGASAAAMIAAFDRLGSPAAAQSLKAIKVSEAIHLGMYVSVYAAKHGGLLNKPG
ncbi:ABC transporter substrate-binding protein, partial [Rhodopseudomonas sp. WA056]|nr:ABC transporter substrate-binding protein [Rhodopseudomonas sp. WA056]